MKSHQILAIHILDAIGRNEQYVSGMDEGQFTNNFLVQDAVIRNIEVIAEASKKIPQEIKIKYPDIPWRQIMAMRNKIIHEYFGVDLSAIWNVVMMDLPELKTQMKLIKR